ncbi:hypothetical protein EOD42_13910 [Rhodovarius crocodyli]|uniref:Uncharacterized protein n=1 Tax=Rhodovarius crocodyli TaxID=1979269 RepID=A0A437MEZ6_9PROT|nr:hypothetical protein [Rhodovarius crocodyli]RVT96207.1 hypothetical protein EOD42_13910 [Rhodovarius crocodyli]
MSKLRISALVLLAIAGAVWLAGTALALSVVAPRFCPQAYYAWAATWPVWLVAPTSWREAFFAWTFGWCMP